MRLRPEPKSQRRPRSRPTLPTGTTTQSNARRADFPFGGLPSFWEEV